MAKVTPPDGSEQRLDRHAHDKNMCRFEVEKRSEKKHGCVCSKCGRTVTEAEYSTGEAVCCRAEVIAEEFYR